eukprot:s196_g35.t2
MVHVNISLPSGRRACLEVRNSCKVGKLKFLAQKALGQGFLKLVTVQGLVLSDPLQSCRNLGLQDGDHLTAVVQQAKLAATERAFALWCYGGDAIVTWGDPDFGAASSMVQHQLRNVQHVQAAGTAFAAILGDGSVVTWGNRHHGGDSSAVAFAAILADGSVVTWGSRGFGGDSSAVQHQLRSVQHLQGTNQAFAAVLSDGSVVTWGDRQSGGDSSQVKDQLASVQQIQASNHAFAAILEDGSVVTWGSKDHGGDSSAVRDQLRKVQQVQATHWAFAAILEDGSVVTWGTSNSGGDSSAVQDQLRNVRHIKGTNHAFAAILQDGTVVTWGFPGYGGDISGIRPQLSNVRQLQATDHAFAALLEDGSLVTWGDPQYGGDSSEVQDQLRDVQHIEATGTAFAAILLDGSVVSWGSAASGGGSSAVRVLILGGCFIDGGEGGGFGGYERLMHDCWEGRVDFATKAVEWTPWGSQMDERGRRWARVGMDASSCTKGPQQQLVALLPGRGVGGVSFMVSHEAVSVAAVSRPEGEALPWRPAQVWKGP